MMIDSIGDLQKPDKILFDNTNLLYTLATRTPDIGTAREVFFVNQLSNAGHLDGKTYNAQGGEVSSTGVERE